MPDNFTTLYVRWPLTKPTKCSSKILVILYSHISGQNQRREQQKNNENMSKQWPMDIAGFLRVCDNVCASGLLPYTNFGVLSQCHGVHQELRVAA